MKKKYPKAWVQLIQKHLQGAVEYGIARGNGDIYSQLPLFNWEPVLEEMDAAGMLREVPAPLEIEFCVSHNAGKHSDSIGCFFRYNHPSERTIMCVFETMISKRAVE